VSTAWKEECDNVEFSRTDVTPCPESVSELYRPSDRRLTEKLVPTVADRGGATWSA
jgi:hypothetical protein